MTTIIIESSKANIQYYLPNRTCQSRRLCKFDDALQPIRGGKSVKKAVDTKRTCLPAYTSPGMCNAQIYPGGASSKIYGTSDSNGTQSGVVIRGECAVAAAGYPTEAMLRITSFCFPMSVWIKKSKSVIDSDFLSCK